MEKGSINVNVDPKPDWSTSDAAGFPRSFRGPPTPMKFYCTIQGCKRSYKRQHDRKRHINEAHNKRNRGRCQFCGRNMLKRSLNRHTKRSCKAFLKGKIDHEETTQNETDKVESDTEEAVVEVVASLTASHEASVTAVTIAEADTTWEALWKVFVTSTELCENS